MGSFRKGSEHHVRVMWRAGPLSKQGFFDQAAGDGLLVHRCFLGWEVLGVGVELKPRILFSIVVPSVVRHLGERERPR